MMYDKLTILRTIHVEGNAPNRGRDGNQKSTEMPGLGEIAYVSSQQQGFRQRNGGRPGFEYLRMNPRAFLSSLWHPHDPSKTLADDPVIRTRSVLDYIPDLHGFNPEDVIAALTTKNVKKATKKADAKAKEDETKAAMAYASLLEDVATVEAALAQNSKEAIQLKSRGKKAKPVTPSRNLLLSLQKKLNETQEEEEATGRDTSQLCAFPKAHLDFIGQFLADGKDITDRTKQREYLGPLPNKLTELPVNPEFVIFGTMSTGAKSVRAAYKSAWLFAVSKNGAQQLDSYTASSNDPDGASEHMNEKPYVNATLMGAANLDLAMAREGVGHKDNKWPADLAERLIWGASELTGTSGAVFKSNTVVLRISKFSYTVPSCQAFAEGFDPKGVIQRMGEVVSYQARAWADPDDPCVYLVWCEDPANLAAFADLPNAVQFTNFLTMARAARDLILGTATLAQLQGTTTQKTNGQTTHAEA